ncbi:Telomeric repeat-binding factor [Trema orientale]|uniref:MYB transcription factor n=1 Tax=Trema orientale TaxID=63057 RepID=A0A2P5FSC9_TREOI|nr:Telomeric repeat-binding factor [Trema orientale]
MGAPKQKWTAEEEAALKAGVIKHGAGKWRTILTDPEFSSILHLRSNVDLKDKWRNINVTAIWGSRQKAKLALKRNLQTPKHENKPLPVSTLPQNDEETVDAKPLAVSGETQRNTNSKEPNARLDKLILDAITNLKEPRGSDRAAIAIYIEEQYWAPPNLKKLLSTKLKHMTANGKLIKVKHRYRIAPSLTSAEKRRASPMLLLEGRPKDYTIAEKTEVNILTKSQVDADLTKMRSMTAQEAAAAAAQAVAEAEAAIAAAEEAAREAEAAEAEAEAAQVFAKAAMKALKSKKLRCW